MDRGEGLAGGELIWAVGLDTALQSSFSDVSLVSVPVLFAAAFQHRWFHWEELMLNDKDGKPKVHSIPDSSLVSGGGTQCSEGAGWLIAH